jgi:hypothetical protein
LTWLDAVLLLSIPVFINGFLGLLADSMLWKPRVHA